MRYCKLKKIRNIFKRIANLYKILVINFCVKFKIYIFMFKQQMIKFLSFIKLHLIIKLNNLIYWEILEHGIVYVCVCIVYTIYI